MLDDPFKEVQLVQLNEADVLHILAETLVAHYKGHISGSDLGRTRTMTAFSQMAPVELLVTHVAFLAAMRQKGTQDLDIFAHTTPLRRNIIYNSQEVGVS